MSSANGTNQAPAREGRVSLAEAAKTGRRRANSGSVGFPGLNRFRGLINEEYVSQLSGARAIDVYTKMRSDGLVEALLAALRLPVMAASWVVEPAGKDRNAKRAAELVEENFFGRLGACWEDEIREALNYLWFGFHCAAKNWTVERGSVWLSELRPLHPKTILQGGKNWVFDDAGRVIGVWQSGWDAERYREEEIPGEALLLFTHDGSYRNPQGRSVLRASYKHWLIVDTLYRIQAIGLERSAIGTPMGKYPAGASDDVKDEIEAFLKYVQAQENGYGLFEVGTEVENFSLDIKTADISAAINHHGTRMAQSVLAQFLHLGQDGSKGGAYALSADQTDLFMLSLSSIADYVAARFNRDVIPELVGYNLATDQFPRLSATISRQSATALAQLLRPLASGVNPLITWGEGDEDWLRERCELPERTEERAPKALPQGRTPGQPPQPGAQGDGEPQQQSRPRIELQVFQDPPQFRGEEPAYPALGEVAEQCLAALAAETERFRAKVWSLLALPEPGAETLARFNNPPEQALTEAQRRALDEAINRFLAEVFGETRTEAGFVETPDGDGAEDALLQSFLRLGHSVGVQRATQLTGSVPAASVTRDSPQVRRVLTDAFARLTQNGRKKLGHQLADVRELLTERSLVGKNPLVVAKELDAAFTGLQRHEWERLARTEMAFAANQGTVDEFAAEGVEEVENLVSPLACAVCQSHANKRVKVSEARVGVNIAPFHPHCMDSISAVVE